MATGVRNAGDPASSGMNAVAYRLASLRPRAGKTASGYALRGFPRATQKADNSCATEPDRSKNPRHRRNGLFWRRCEFFPESGRVREMAEALLH